MDKVAESGLNTKQEDGEAMHLNIRMGQNNQHVIIVNSYHHGHWGHEEKHCLFVKPGGPLHIRVECHHNHYDILVNGRSFKFPYRLRTREVNRLEIRGDLIIRRLNMQKVEGHIQLMNTYPSYPQPYPIQPYPTQPYPTQPYPTQPYPTQAYATAPTHNAPMGQGYYPPLSQPYVPQLQPSYPNQQYQGHGQPPPTYYRS
ncbi:Galectin [Aphelenchoides bicaudatus]|nr:Galectin [Aphelenchoides bicaudatus]